MADSATFDGKEYISSKRASELSDYAQDYIGQLARKGLIEARRVGGLWYVLWESLDAYTTKAESYKPQPPNDPKVAKDPEAFVSFDGKAYLSASAAAKRTGYHQDYVGQLARSGKIPSRQIGNRWYVDHESLATHKSEKDALLAAVQVESTGVVRHNFLPGRHGIKEPFFTYSSESSDLLPALLPLEQNEPFSEEIQDRTEHIPIRIVRNTPPRREIFQQALRGSSVRKRNSPEGVYFALGALTIVVILSVGFVSLKGSSLHAQGPSVRGELASIADAGGIVGDFAEWVESFFAQQPSYVRGK